MLDIHRLESDETTQGDYDTTQIIDRLSGPLFKAPAEQLKYAVTVNVQPTRLVNKRQWKLYKPDQQRAILSRMEAFIRRVTPSIKLHELHFETCPNVGNIHFHALYEMPREYLAELECQWNRLIGTIVNAYTKTDSKSVWRHLDVQEVYNEEEWLKYIKKDANKV